MLGIAGMPRLLKVTCCWPAEALRGVLDGAAGAPAALQLCDVGSARSLGTRQSHGFVRPRGLCSSVQDLKELMKKRSGRSENGSGRDVTAEELRRPLAIDDGTLERIECIGSVRDPSPRSRSKPRRCPRAPIPCGQGTARIRVTAFFLDAVMDAMPVHH
jgi:hypothetical protein